MFWPTSVEHVKNLPEVELKVHGNKFKSDSITFNSNDGKAPHLDPIIGMACSESPIPYAVITYRSIYLFDSITHSPIAAHVRSDQSVESYGKNIKIIKSEHGGRRFAIETDENFLLIYTIKTTSLTNYHNNDDETSGFSSRDEILTIFSREGKVLQNGFPIQSNDGNIVQSLMSAIFSKDQKEKPNYDMGLRLKVILKVQSPLRDYFFISSNQILLGTRDPAAFQIISLNASNKDIDPNDPGKHIEVVLMEGFEWYKDESQSISSFHYNAKLGCFAWINEKGNCWLTTITGDHSVKFLGAQIYDSDSEKDQAKCVLINEHRNLITIGTKSGELHIYKLERDLGVTKLRLIKKPIHSIGLEKLILSPRGDAFITIYQNGWNLHSPLGNMSFSTYDVDSITSSLDWYSNVIDIQFLSAYEIALATSNHIYVLGTTQLNHSSVVNQSTLKRPVLYSTDNIHVFKGYDKSLIEHHSTGHTSTNKETYLWAVEMLPESFRMSNNEIRCVAASDDGSFVCVVGNMNVIVFDFIQNTWKLLTHGHDSMGDVQINPVRVCLWWKNYLVLGSRTHDIHDLKNKGKCKSEVIVFAPHVLKEGTEFTFEQVMWGFNFDETPFDENFLYLNIDSATDQLLVFSDLLNCYTWKMTLTPPQKDVGTYKGKTKKSKADQPQHLTKSTVVLKKSVVYQLKNCLLSDHDSEIDISTLLNFRAAIKINESDLLLLIASTLVYIKKRTAPLTPTPSSPDQQQQQQQQQQQRPRVFYHTLTLMEGVEYINKLTPNLIAVFNGAHVIHYDLTNESDLSNIIPIQINIGNETTSEAKPSLSSVTMLGKRLSGSVEPNASAVPSSYSLQSSDPQELLAKTSDLTLEDEEADATNGNANKYEPIIMDSNGTTGYPIVSIPEKNMIFGVEIDINQIEGLASTNSIALSSASATSDAGILPKSSTNHSMQVIKLEIVKTNYLSSLVDYYVGLNVQLEMNEINDFEALSIPSIYKRFHRFKHFSFCLEILLSNYIIYTVSPDASYSDGKNSNSTLTDSKSEDHYFQAIIKLISMTGMQYTIYLNLLKKIEIEYWNVFFEKLGETPRQSLDKIFNTLMDYKLSAHYFIIMLNYGKEKSKSDATEKGIHLSEQDQTLVSQILVNLVTLEKDYVTAFELLRFIKLVDENTCQKITKTLEKHLKNN